MNADRRSTAPIRPRRAQMVIAGALAVLLLAVACGDSADEASGPTPTSATPTTASGATSGVEEYCTDVLAIETVGEPDVDFESATEEEIAAAVKKQGQEEYLPLAREIQAVAPDEIADDIDTLVAAVEELAVTGDFEATFETPEVAAAEDRVHAFDLANCGWGQVDVTAIDYAFQGIDATYEPGPTSFELSNRGEELHEMALFKKAEGVVESFEEIFGGGEEEAMQKITPIGGAFAEPGGDDHAVFELEPGEYAAVCFIPVGTTPEAAAAAEQSGERPEGGPPHFTRGMLSEFTVG